MKEAMKMWQVEDLEKKESLLVQVPWERSFLDYV